MFLVKSLSVLCSEYVYTLQVIKWSILCSLFTWYSYSSILLQKMNQILDMISINIANLFAQVSSKVWFTEVFKQTPILTVWFNQRCQKFYHLQNSLSFPRINIPYSLHYHRNCLFVVLNCFFFRLYDFRNTWLKPLSFSV